MKRNATAAALITAGLLVSGCSSDGQEQKNNDPTAAVLKAARAYQKAANADDWAEACARSSARLRDGSVKECTAAHADEETPTPEPSASSSSFEPPTYADGSTPDPIKTSTPSGPDRADTGPVSASADDVVKVPAAGDHPSGYGVLVSYTVKWPGEDATTSRRALRLVHEGGKWVVDQHEDVQDGDMGHGSPVRAALSGG